MLHSLPSSHSPDADPLPPPSATLPYSTHVCPPIATKHLTLTLTLLRQSFGMPFMYNVEYSSDEISRLKAWHLHQKNKLFKLTLCIRYVDDLNKKTPPCRRIGVLIGDWGERHCALDVTIKDPTNNINSERHSVASKCLNWQRRHKPTTESWKYSGGNYSWWGQLGSNLRKSPFHSRRHGAMGTETKEWWKGVAKLATENPQHHVQERQT